MAKLQQFFAIAFVTLIFQTHLIAALLGLIGGVINGVAQMLSPQPNLYNQYANPFPFPPIGPNGVQKSLYDQVSPDIKMNYLQYYQTRSWPNYVYPTTGIAGAFTTVGQSIDFAVQNVRHVLAGLVGLLGGINYPPPGDLIPPQNRTNTTKPETKDNNENDEKKEDENNAA